MVQSTAAARQKFAHAIVGAERLQQLDFAVADLEQGRFDPLLLNRGAPGEFQPQRIAPEPVSFLQIGNDHSNVMNPFQHRFFATDINLIDSAQRGKSGQLPGTGRSRLTAPVRSATPDSLSARSICGSVRVIVTREELEPWRQPKTISRE